VRPNDEALLAESNRARSSGDRVNRTASLFNYFTDLLQKHWNGKSQFSGDIWNRDAVLPTRDRGVCYRWVTCKLSDVPCMISISFHLNSVEADIPSDIVVPMGYIVTKCRRTFQILICFASSQINYLVVQMLLALSKWTQIYFRQDEVMIQYQFELPDSIDLPKPNAFNKIEIDKAKFGDLLALTRSLDLPLELT
jgi:hypothetical protein